MIKTGEENLRPLHYQQNVEFNGQEDQHSVELYSTDVTIVPSSGGHDHGSSKVKLKNIVDFTWEHHFYYGQLLAVHMSGKYIAYGIKVGTGGGVVRVVYKELQQRALLRGMRGAIQDLAFAHVSNAFLACVDYLGNLFIHTIESTPTELSHSLVLQVNAEDVSPTSHRVIWCPYIPDDDPSDGDVVSKLLVLTRGSKAELWSVATVASRFRSIEATDPAVKESGGMLQIDQHTDTIVEATFSPDGTAFATASLDGAVKFFQVADLGNSLGSQTEPRCLHNWRPHDGRPISCLFFLDDHKTFQPDVQFWRFAVTGCDNNSELKIWSCQLWSCLQTIKFAPTPTSGKLPVLKAGLDLSAEYLLLSDIYNRVLYILSLAKESEEAIASVTTVSEFLLPYPILSFGIVDAGQRKVRPIGESLEDLCPCDEEAEEQLVIRMYLVQPKSLQECHIAFKPASQVGSNCLMGTLNHDSLDYAEDLPDMVTVNHNRVPVENCQEDCTLSATIEAATNHNTSLNLMTPDAFSSPAKKDTPEVVPNHESPELGKVLSASPAPAQPVQPLNTTDAPLATSELEGQAPASSGSSPSREVREILSLTKPEEEETETENENKPETNDAGDKDWPDIPMGLLKDVQAMQEAEDSVVAQEERVQRKQPKEEVTSAPHTPIDTKAPWQPPNDPKADDISSKLESILETMQGQHQELRELRAEVTRLRQETPIATRVESAITRASQQQSASLEQTLFGQMSRQHEFLNTLQTTIKDKIEATLPRMIQDTVDPLKDQLRLYAKLMDQLLKDNLTELIGSAQIKDAVALTVANAAKPALEVAFKEAFMNVLLPGMEKACQTMFRQVQDAFVRGTREYLQSVDAIADKQYQRHNEEQSEALSTMVRDELQTEFSKGLTTLQEAATRTIRDSIRDNLNKQLNEITAARSRSATPAITVPAVAEAHARVLSFLQRGQLNAAFQLALSASDLSLVVLVCERTDPSNVFSSPVGTPAQGTRCILQQPVILSLVQQLSADLEHQTDLKHMWLEKAIFHLDPEDPVTREHMGTVLLNLQSRLVAFAVANPTHKCSRRMKGLAMAAGDLRS